jgi:hypothetical protein
MSAKPVIWLNVSQLPRRNVHVGPRLTHDVWDVCSGTALVFLVVSLIVLVFA